MGLNNAFPDLHSTDNFLVPIDDTITNELNELKKEYNSLSLNNKNLVESEKFKSLQSKFTNLNTSSLKKS